MTEHLLNTVETAKILGLARQTLELWRVRGRGPRFVKIGRAVRYRRDDVQGYLDGLKSFNSTAEAGSGETCGVESATGVVGLCLDGSRVAAEGVDNRS